MMGGGPPGRGRLARLARHHHVRCHEYRSDRPDRQRVALALSNHTVGAGLSTFLVLLVPCALAAQGGGNANIVGRVSAGASSLASQEDFWLETSTLGVVRDRDLVSFSKKGITGGAGLCLRFGGGARLTGFLGISGNYTQLGADATKDLRNAEPT